MIAGVRRAFLDRRGVAAIEFALIGLIMGMLLLGTFEGSLLVRANMKVSAAAETMADLVAQQSAVSASIMTNFCNGAKLVMAPFGVSSLSVAVASVTKNATTGTIALDWHDETCGSAASLASRAVALATPYLPNKGDSVIIAAASYAYASPSSLVFNSSYGLYQVSFGRPRANATITHS